MPDGFPGLLPDFLFRGCSVIRDGLIEEIADITDGIFLRLVEARIAGDLLQGGRSAGVVAVADAEAHSGYEVALYCGTGGDQGCAQPVKSLLQRLRVRGDNRLFVAPDAHIRQ